MSFNSLNIRDPNKMGSRTLQAKTFQIRYNMLIRKKHLEIYEIGRKRNQYSSRCSFSMMVKWANDCLLQAYASIIHVYDGKVLINDGEVNKWSYTHLTIIEKLHRLYSSGKFLRNWSSFCFFICRSYSGDNSPIRWWMVSCVNTVELKAPSNSVLLK